MKKKKAVTKQLTEQESQLVEHLRRHPEMMARFQTILDITRNAEGPLKRADEVEELLIEEIRRLGNVSMSQWASQAEERVSGEVRDQDATVLSRKKNAEVVVCLWVGQGEGEDLVQSHPELPAPLAQAIGS